MTKFTEERHPGEAILSEGQRAISREKVTIAENQTIKANALIAKIAVAAGVEVATTYSGTGNGTMTVASPAVSTKVKDGVYKAVCNAVAANGGKFDVSDPGGVPIGVATVGSAFNKEIKFTINDGATDFAIGDTFEITVAANGDDFQWVNYDPAGTDGSEVPGGFSIYPVTTGAGETMDTTALVRLCELNGNCISWPASITTAQRADAIQALQSNNIIVRF